MQSPNGQQQPLQAKAVRWKETENGGSTSETSQEIKTIAQHVQIGTTNPHELKQGPAQVSSCGEVRQQDEQQIQQLQQVHPRFKLNWLMQTLSITAMHGQLVMINLSRRGLDWSHAHAIREALLRNPHLSVLKLSYNDLEDRGIAIIASGFIMPNRTKHPSLTVLDAGFNAIGDAGCAALALHALAGNYTITTLYLSGNQFRRTGAMAVAGAILQGCNLTTLYLEANFIGQIGVQALARAIAEREALVARIGDNEQKTMQKMYLSGIDMGSQGFVTLSSMLLTNFSIRTLCLSNNGVDDHCMALLAQSLSRNKGLPLEVIQLSFNQISDVGVECFMNAVWGSQTLKEIRFDNNLVRDRGAQLASVVLTSIKLEVIDLSFNKITTVGIKALMKSLSENASLLYLGLSGISIDANSAKALSYGLAYNSTLRYLHVDNCQIGYAAQRHIIAGVVSNRLASLRVLTGFPVGTICTTLGLPKPLEEFTNDQCLSFIRRMWKQWREENEFSNKPLEVQAEAARSLGPAAPPDVVRASRMALQLLGPNGAAVLQTEDHQKDLSETSPLVNTNDIMLERTASGTLRVPFVAQDAQMEEFMTAPPPQAVLSNVAPDLKQVEQAQKDRNLQWLRAHFQSLHQVGQLPFNEADLWQLHQYFFSPLVPVDGEQSEKSGSTNSTTQSPEETNATVSTVLSSPPLQSSPLPFDTGFKSQVSRSLSFQVLGDASSTVESVGSFSTTSNFSNRRRTLGTMEEKEECDDTSTSSEEGQPVSKRARNFRPRISFYPRIRSLLENLGTKQSQHQCLSLLRQLKFVESVLFKGRDVYGNELHQPDEVTPVDLEMIILDLL